jgi:hypothetical protein
MVERGFIPPFVNLHAEPWSSIASWADNFRSIEGYTFHKPLRATIDMVFGRLDDQDKRRLQHTGAQKPIRPSKGPLSNEADVCSFYRENIDNDLAYVWQNPYQVLSASMDDGTAGFRYFRGSKAQEGPLTIGVIKPPGTIDKTWRVGNAQSSLAMSLGRELRG